MSAYNVALTVTVRIEIDDDAAPTAITRATENHDDQGNPQPDERNGSGFRNMLYDLRDRDDVLEHLAYNCAANGVRDATRLDGWADLPRDAITMDVTDATLESVDVLPAVGASS